MRDDSHVHVRRDVKSQPSLSSLKSYRYEQFEEGLPPRTRAVNASHYCGSNSRNNSPTNSPAADRSPLPFSHANTSSRSLRPRTSPSPHPPKSPIERFSVLSESDEVKRDSGIAPSVSPATSTEHFSADTRAAREPTLPSIVVQNDETAATGRSRSSSGTWQNKREHPQRSAKSNIRSASASPSRPAKMSSIEALPTQLPATSASMDHLSLEDLASDKVGFSTRGSILFGGRKMQDLIHAQGDDRPRNASSGVTTPIHSAQADNPYVLSEPTVKAVAPESDTPADGHQQRDPTATHEQFTPGLVAGRRKPSVHMLQAAIHGGRVLSAEEITFSMKVRNMYEHGDERAAEWINPASIATSGKTTPELTRHSSSPDMGNCSLSVHKTRELNNDNWPLTENRSSYLSAYSRDTHELAGGIEDWEDIDSSAVDRYGFIHQDRTSGRASAMSDRQQLGTGMQRVATSLRVEAEQPRRERKLVRGPSNARSSRSVPPRPSNDWAGKKGSPSVHSTHSMSSTRNPFRSRTKRLLAEASDMLTLPPGLEDIAENEDAGKTASVLKQREWAREEKWRKMARPAERSREAKGGGMHFEFDTTDAKLIERTWKGIPDRWRATAWHNFLATSARRRTSPATDEELIGQFHKLQAMSCADDVQIDVDVPRTIQLHVMFRRRYRGGQRLLFRVLHAMALYFPGVGYVQGMASIAVTLLCYFDEENAFVMMVRMWQLRGLESFFKENFSGLMAALEDFDNQWLLGGAVHDKLAELGITSMTYGTRWYLTLFNMSVPFPAQLRIWDVFMLLGDDLSAPKPNPPPSAHGDVTPMKGLSTDSHAFGGASLDVLHATSAALIDATRGIILDSDFENAMKVLTSFIPIKDEDMLMRVARTEWKLHQKKKA
ncbi:hypothetical protein AC579_8246 [Pseudocercospora musae]|uniref:Rab-GAP TBC domain-containing protein n=1 Tax=Pseudocercospora musae TaxID=113226 RepID=A0A139IVV3_9PEZI|nr:hypothetical protein AC579_8246 [Pseudocercospora musae]